MTEKMPQYQSHKKVRALKIRHVIYSENNMCELIFVDDRFTPLSLTYQDRPQPDAGWYYIVYEDGYYSFSPAAQFEEGYTKL